MFYLLFLGLFLTWASTANTITVKSEHISEVMGLEKKIIKKINTYKLYLKENIKK